MIIILICIFWDKNYNMHTRLINFFNLRVKQQCGFRQRLKKLNYDIAQLPIAFCDAITFEFMDNPMMVDNIPSYRLDASEVANHPFNPFVDVAEKKPLIVAPHRQLRQQIDCFISQLETIRALEIQLSHNKTAHLREHNQTIEKKLLQHVNEFIKTTSLIIEDSETQLLEPYKMLREDLQVRARPQQKPSLTEQKKNESSQQWQKIRDYLHARDNRIFLEKSKAELTASLDEMRNILAADNLSPQQIDIALATQVSELRVIDELLDVLTCPENLPQVSGKTVWLFARHLTIPAVQLEVTTTRGCFYQAYKKGV